MMKKAIQWLRSNTWLYWLIGALVALVILKPLWKTIWSYIKSWLQNLLPVDDDNLTFDDSEYRVFADSIEGHLSAWVGESQESVMSILRMMKTKDDVRALYNAFGKRYNSGSWLDYKPTDLVYWLNSEMSSDYKDEINDILTLGGLSTTEKVTY